jgi:GTPase SAR1 family protein
MHSETAKIFLCGSKLDLNDEQVTEKDIEDFTIQCDAVLSGTYRISSKTNEGVQSMFKDIAEKLVIDAKERSDSTTIRPGENSPVAQQHNQKCCNK